MKYAIIENSKVVNIAVSETPLAENWVEAGSAKIGDTWDGETFTPPPAPSPTDKNINAERERRLAAGSSFTVAGVVDPIPLQGRPFDQTVYLALLTRANGLKSAGVITPALTLRDGADTIHELTPDQMISLISQSMTWFESVMATSWAMKDGAAPFETGIPADYTADTHWPE